jgi:hypothetical protein
MTSDDPSTPSYGEQPAYFPQPGAGALPPPPGNVPPDPTQQFQPPQPPKKRRALRITLTVLGSVVGLFIALAVVGAIVSPKTTPAASHTSTPVTHVTKNVTTTPPANTFTDPAGGVCNAGSEANGYCPGDSPSPTPPPPPPPPPPTYNPVTDSQWQLIQENPAGYIGQTFTVTGTVTQHDANTGADEFRADAGPADNPNTNTIFDGSNDGSQVAPLQVGQTFTAEVSVEGSITYTTTLGGSDTAPELLVVSITQT